MDNQVVATIAAQDTRDGMPSGVLGSDHGFTYDMTQTPYGKHVFKVIVVDDANGKQTQIGQANITVNTSATGASRPSPMSPPPPAPSLAGPLMPTRPRSL